MLSLTPAANPASEINVNVAVKTNGPDKPSSGSGGFWVDAGSYGRVSLTFPKDVDSYRITSSGSKQGPVLRYIGDDTYQVSGDNDVALMSDIYLKPSVTAKGEIRLDGAVINISKGQKSLLYDYSEEKIDLILTKDGHQLVKLSNSPEGKDIYLEISASSGGNLIYDHKTSRYGTLQTEYSLFNEDTKKYELQGCKATLGFSDDEDEATGSTSNKKFFRLSDKDSLLYISSFDMNTPVWNSDNSLTFDFDLVRFYILNPDNTALFPNEIKGERTTIVTSLKKITISPGEKTEIEIPPSANSELPFDAKETIILTYEMEKSQN